MALNRPISYSNAARQKNIVLGYDKGPRLTTYHATYELNMPRTLPIRYRFHPPPSEIFHRTEPKCPLTEQQISFGDTPSFVTNRIYNERIKNLRSIMGLHLLSSVPMGHCQDASHPTETSQMRTDYVDRHHELHDWTKVQTPDLPKLPPIKLPAQKKNNHLRWYGHRTEAAYQFQWPGREGSNKVKFGGNWKN